MAKKTQPSDKFKFFNKKTLREEKGDFTDWQLAQLQSKLTRGIYWIQVEKRGLVQFNWTLIQSYLIHGADSPEHHALIEEYISTLPQAA
jgi:hypothetical protein